MVMKENSEFGIRNSKKNKEVEGDFWDIDIILGTVKQRILSFLFFFRIPNFEFRIYLSFLFLIGVAGAAPYLQAADAQVNASINDNLGQENAPPEGTIFVNHSKKDEIDAASFNMNNQKLAVNFVKDEPLSQDSVISIYSFNLPAQPAGLYILPEIKVKVGSQIFQSIPSTYQIVSTQSPVKARSTSSPEPTYAPPQASVPQGTPTLKLEAKVKGPTSLYPGQRTTLIYRILYNRSVNLTEEKLPLFHPSDFQKIGDAHITNYQETIYTVQEIAQEIEAINAGTFSLGPSSIAGYFYEVDSSGQKVYNPTPLQAAAPVIQIVVHPFPVNDQPYSFNGSLGTVQTEINMTTPKSVNVGERVRLNLSVKGLVHPSEMKLPDLNCQPGFSGFFLLSDLPVAPTDNGGVAQFQIELMPLTSLIKAIPSIEISSFDPEAGAYKVQKTTPLALEVKAPASITQINSSQPKPELSTPDWNKVWQAAFQPAPALILQDHPLPPSYAPLPWIETSWVFLVIPLGALFLFLMQKWFEYRTSHPIPAKPRSELLLERALYDKDLSPIQVVRLLEQAFWWRIHEKGFLKLAPDLESLPSDGWIGQVRDFIFHLQSIQYSQNKQFVLSDVKAQAQTLSKEIRSI